MFIFIWKSRAREAFWLGGLGSRWKAPRTLPPRWKAPGLKPKLTFHWGTFVKGLFTCYHILDISFAIFFTCSFIYSSNCMYANCRHFIQALQVLRMLWYLCKTRWNWTRFPLSETFMLNWNSKQLLRFCNIIDTFKWVTGILLIRHSWNMSHY